MLQNLFFLFGCLGGFIVFVWSMMAERALHNEARKKAREAFSETMNQRR